MAEAKEAISLCFEENQYTLRSDAMLISRTYELGCLVYNMIYNELVGDSFSSKEVAL
jgi:hypothetical protein